MTRAHTAAASTLLWLAALSAPAVAQVLPPSAQPGVQALANAVGAQRASLTGTEVRLQVGQTAVTLRHLGQAPWFEVLTKPDNPQLARQVAAALPRAFAADPWQWPKPPETSKPLLAQLPDARFVPQRYALGVAAAAGLIALLGMWRLLRQP